SNCDPPTLLTAVHDPKAKSATPVGLTRPAYRPSVPAQSDCELVALWNDVESDRFSRLAVLTLDVKGTDRPTQAIELFHHLLLIISASCAWLRYHRPFHVQQRRSTPNPHNARRWHPPREHAGPG